jgi:hypothetical protein
VFTKAIRDLMHLREDAPASGKDTTAEPEGPEGPPAPPLLQTALRLFPPAAAGRHGWQIQCRGPDGKARMLAPGEAEAHQDEPKWKMGLIYYGSGEPADGPSNFRIGINVQPSQTPAVAALLLPLLDLPYVGQFKTYVPEDAGDVLDNTIIYYHEDDTKEQPNTTALATRLRDVGLKQFTQEDHSGLMEPLAGTPGAAFAVHEAGTAYSRVRSEQIATALWPLLADPEGRVPKIDAMVKVLEEAGLQPRSPHLAPLSFAEDTA